MRKPKVGREVAQMVMMYAYLQDDTLPRARYGGASHRQPSQRALSSLGPHSPALPGPPVADPSPPGPSPIATLPAHLQGGVVLAAPHRVDTPPGGIKLHEAQAAPAVEAEAMEAVGEAAAEVEEPEEGELEPGERGADWESGPEEEARSEAEPAEMPGRNVPEPVGDQVQGMQCCSSHASSSPTECMTALLRTVQ